MSAICGVCNVSCSDVNKVVKCVGPCGRVFHLECVTSKTRGSTKDWYCEDCKKSKPASTTSSRSAESTSVTKEFLVNVIESFKAEVFQELKNHSSQLNDFKKSLEFFSAKMDEHTKTMELIKEQNKTINKENEILKRSNAELVKNMSVLEAKVRDLEQYSRRDNIEVNGIPKTNGEDVKEILKVLGRAIGMEVDSSAVVAAHRVPSYNKTRTPALIARFNTRELRDTWLLKFRAKKTLLASEINANFPQTKVYIGEHLTPDNKLLFRNLKDESHHLRIKYVWCREGRFYARKSDEHNSVRVYTVDDLRTTDWGALLRKKA